MVLFKGEVLVINIFEKCEIFGAIIKLFVGDDTILYEDVDIVPLFSKSFLSFLKRSSSLSATFLVMC